MSWRRCRAASRASGDVGEAAPVAGLDRAGEGDHTADAGQAVGGGRATGGGSGGGGPGQVLDLEAEDVGVGAEGLVELVGVHRERLDLRGFAVPGVVDLPDDAAGAAVDLEALPVVHTDSDGQVELAQAAVLEVGFEEPAVGARLGGEPGADRGEGPAEVAGGVEQVAAVAQDEVTLPVGLRVAGGAPGGGTGFDDRLESVGHRVPVGGVAVPVLEGDELADLVL